MASFCSFRKEAGVTSCPRVNWAPTRLLRSPTASSATPRRTRPQSLGRGRVREVTVKRPGTGGHPSIWEALESLTCGKPRCQTQAPPSPPGLHPECGVQGLRQKLHKALAASSPVPAPLARFRDLRSFPNNATHPHLRSVLTAPCPCPPNPRWTRTEGWILILSSSLGSTLGKRPQVHPLQQSQDPSLSWATDFEDSVGPVQF